jgi:hypothetical protein
MHHQALFAGLVVDEADRPLEVTSLGGEAQYVIDDEGFHRHIDAVDVDRQVLNAIREQVQSNKELVEQGMMQMIGSDDLFTKAMIDQSIDNFDQVLERGLPPEALQWLGVMGFRIVVDVHGEVIKIEQPGLIDDSGE